MSDCKEEYDYDKLIKIYKKLSQPLIITILSYIKFTPSWPYSQFGYFDETRKISTIFRTVIFYLDFKPEYLIDLPNLETLILDHFPYNKFRNKMGCRAMMNLKRLRVVHCPQLRDEFFKRNKFPNLENLYVRYCVNMFGRGWDLDNFKKLKVLFVLDVFKMEEELFEALEKPKKVVIRGLTNVTGKKWKDSFYKNIEFLAISKCKKFDGSFFTRDDFPLLKKLQLIDLPQLHLSDISHKCIKNISHLSLISLNIDEKFFEHEDWEKLTILELKNLKSDNKKLSWKSDLVNQLELLVISSCDHLFDNSFFKNYSFSNLKTLELSNINSINGEHFSMLKKLNNLQIYHCKNFSDEFFHLKGIEEYVIGYSNNMKFVNINTDNIKKLQIDACVSLTDDFFISNSFKKLETLYLLELEKIIGEKWSDLSSLKLLEIDKCSQICDSFFIQNNMPNLEHLRLQHLSNISGKNWKELKCLKSLVVRKCKSFHDELFQKQTFSKLLNLELHDLPKIQGKNWNEMTCLKRIEVFFCLSFSDELLAHNLFPHIVKIRLAKISKTPETMKWKWDPMNFKSLKKIFVNGKYFKDIQRYRKIYNKRGSKKKSKRNKSHKKKTNVMNV